MKRKATSTAAPANFGDLWINDQERQGIAFQEILGLTSLPVPWSYEVWDDVIAQLTDKNNRNRSIAAQVLCNLAKSDPQTRLLDDFPKLFAVTGDDRFVTARHCLQSLWKVGCVGQSYRQMLVKALERWYVDCVKHKNCTLIRYDIIESFRKLYDAIHDEDLQTRALALIELEPDPKYKKKYTTLWPNRGTKGANRT